MSTPSKTRAAALPKPRVTPATGPHRSWAIDFGNGCTGKISQPWELLLERWSEYYFWTVTFADGTEEDGRACSDSLAFSCAWCCAAKSHVVAPVKLSREQVQALADQAEGDSREGAKAIRKILKVRTGRTWSVVVGKRSWISVSSSPKRRVFGFMTAHDSALLAVVAGEKHVSTGGMSIRPDRGVGAALIWDIAGLERPADLKIAAPSWD